MRYERLQSLIQNQMQQECSESALMAENSTICIKNKSDQHIYGFTFSTAVLHLAQSPNNNAQFSAQQSYFFLWLVFVGPQFKTQSWLQLAPLCVGLHNWKQLVHRQSVISLSFSWCRCCCCWWITFAWWHQVGQFGLHRLSGLWLWKDLMWSGGFGRGLGHRWSEGPKVIKGWGHPRCPFFLALKKRQKKEERYSNYSWRQ